jgi:hypothetical protein
MPEYILELLEKQFPGGFYIAGYNRSGVLISQISAADDDTVLHKLLETLDDALISEEDSDDDDDGDDEGF